MGKKKDLIDALRAKTGMSHAAAKRIIEQNGIEAAKVEPVIETVIELAQARADYEDNHKEPVGEEPNIRAIVQQVIDLGQARADYEDERTEKRIRETGSALIMAADLVEERQANGWRRHPTFEALRDFLRKQRREVLLKVIAVMYAGRDDEDPIDMYGMFWNEDAGALASQMLSKSPLADYLRDGLRVAADAGLDLDADWERLARRRRR